jgi:hypothetical protein
MNNSFKLTSSSHTTSSVSLANNLSNRLPNRLSHCVSKVPDSTSSKSTYLTFSQRPKLKMDPLSSRFGRFFKRFRGIWAQVRSVAAFKPPFQKQAQQLP